MKTVFRGRLSACDQQGREEDLIGERMIGPLMTKEDGRSPYVPWSFMDMVGMASRLPALTDRKKNGLQRWKKVQLE